MFVSILRKAMPADAYGRLGHIMCQHNWAHIKNYYWIKLVVQVVACGVLEHIPPYYVSSAHCQHGHIVGVCTHGHFMPLTTATVPGGETAASEQVASVVSKQTTLMKEAMSVKVETNSGVCFTNVILFVSDVGCCIVSFNLMTDWP